MDTPSDKNDKKVLNKPHGLSRKKIIEIALAQLRKKRAETDPKILNIIRDKILSSPAMMQKLGIEGNPVVEEAPKKQKVSEVKKSEDQERLLAHVEQIVKAQKKDEAKLIKSQKPKTEKVDKAKTLETISKLMKIKPDLKN